MDIRRKPLVFVLTVGVLGLLGGMCALHGLPHFDETSERLEVNLIDQMTGAKISNAELTLVDDSGKIIRAVTGASGIGSISGLHHESRYLLHVHHSLYVDRDYCLAANLECEDPIILPAPLGRSDDKNPYRIEMKLKPLGKISGTVLTQDGQPIRALVIALGALEGRIGTVIPAKSSLSDSRGAYTIDSLSPGQYYVGTHSDEVRQNPDGNTTRMRVTFFPGVAESSAATLVSVSPGLDTSGINLPVRFEAGQSVDVQVNGFSGSGMLGIFQGPSFRPQWYSPVVSIPIQADGKATLVAIPEGQYVMRAQAMSGSTVRYGRRLLDVGDHKVENFQVESEEGQNIRGRLIWKGSSTAPAPGSIKVRLTSNDWGFMPDLLASASNDSFVISNAPSGRYALSVTGIAEGWFLETAIYAGRTLDDPGINVSEAKEAELSLSLSLGAASIKGVVEANGKLIAHSPVVLLKDSILSARVEADEKGQFNFHNLKPGLYQLAAFEDSNADAYLVPQQLSRWLSSASVLRVGAESTKTISIKPIPHDDNVLLSYPSIVKGRLGGR